MSEPKSEPPEEAETGEERGGGAPLWIPAVKTSLPQV